MTPAERNYLAKLRRRARRLAPDLAARELAAYDALRALLNERELALVIQSGAVDQIIAMALSDDVMDPALAQLRSVLQGGVLQASQLAAKDLPKSIQTTFGILNPRVVSAAEALDTRVIENLIKADARETFRQHIIAGLEDGAPPLKIARGAKSMLGLAPNQEQAVRNFERMLREGDAEALTRQLRDRRFDGTLRKAFAKGEGLPATRVRSMTEAYRRRMVAFNAQTHARTASIDTQKAGQRVSWEDAVDRGVVDRDRLKRTWITVGDGRVRAQHAALNGETVGFEEPFSNGEMTPGESTYNCRCQARVFQARAA